jgi:hypothetical protein
MRARVLWSGGAALAVALTSLACSLTTDLSGLAQGTTPASSEGGAAEGGGGAGDGSTSGALPDAPAEASDPSAAYEAVVRADGPVAYYRCEDAAGESAAKDAIGARTAYVTGAVTLGGPGVRGRGCAFDGSSALDVGDTLDFAGKQPFTLELWLRARSGKVGGQVIYKRDESQDPFKGYILYGDNDGTPHFEAWGVDLSAYSADVLGEPFSHVVVTVAYAAGKGNATLYVNAKASPTGGFDNTLDLPDTPQHLRFGQYFDGVLDEIALYDKALPVDRIGEHYRAGR